jgi:hypothetical protein
MPVKVLRSILVDSNEVKRGADNCIHSNYLLLTRLSRRGRDESIVAITSCSDIFDLAAPTQVDQIAFGSLVANVELLFQHRSLQPDAEVKLMECPLLTLVQLDFCDSGDICGDTWRVDNRLEF